MNVAELPAVPSFPMLVSSAARETVGQDLLGLRSPAESVAYSLLDGVTTITPLVRYFALRAWIVLRYLRAGGAHERNAFQTFAGKIESAVAYAAVLADDPVRGLVGRDVAALKLAAAGDQLVLGGLTKTPAVRTYGGPAEALGLGRTSKTVPSLTEERGLPLAIAFGFVPEISVLESIGTDGKEQSVSRQTLTEFGLQFSLSKPSEAERAVLIEALLPPNPRPRDLPRIATYCLLMQLCHTLGKTVSESEVLSATCAADLSEIPAELHEACDGWMRFAVRDLLVLVHEAAVARVTRELETAGSAEGRLHFRKVIATLLGEDLDPTLTALGLSVTGDTAISKLCEETLSVMTGMTDVRLMRRWAGEIWEPGVFAMGELSTTAGGLALLPVAWLIATQRLEPALKCGAIGFDMQGLTAASRLGVRDVIVPAVLEWRGSSEPIRSVVARLVQRSVEQHLRIAWSRQAREPHKDVALLRSDGDDWIFMRQLRAGRATSRLYQAVAWLQQLDLVDGRGLTTDGAALLDRGLATLREKEVATQ